MKTEVVGQGARNKEYRAIPAKTLFIKPLFIVTYTEVILLMPFQMEIRQPTTFLLSGRQLALGELITVIKSRINLRYDMLHWIILPY